MALTLQGSTPPNLRYKLMTSRNRAQDGVEKYKPKLDRGDFGLRVISDAFLYIAEVKTSSGFYFDVKDPDFIRLRKKALEILHERDVRINQVASKYFNVREVKEVVRTNQPPASIRPFIRGDDLVGIDDLLAYREIFLKDSMVDSRIKQTIADYLSSDTQRLSTERERNVLRQYLRLTKKRL